MCRSKLCNLTKLLPLISNCIYLLGILWNLMELIQSTWYTAYRTNARFLFYNVLLHNIDSVQFSHSAVSNSLWPHGLQHARPPCPSPIPWVYSNSSPLSQWCHPTISSSVVPFSSCPQFFPASGSFQMSQFFASCGQSIGVSASVLPMTIQDWFLLALTSLISLQSKGLSRVFSNTTVQKHQNPWKREGQTTSVFLLWEPHEQYEKAKTYNMID